MAFVLKSIFSVMCISILFFFSFPHNFPDSSQKRAQDACHIFLAKYIYYIIYLNLARWFFWIIHDDFQSFPYKTSTPRVLTTRKCASVHRLHEVLLFDRKFNVISCQTKKSAYADFCCCPIFCKQENLLNIYDSIR